MIHKTLQILLLVLIYFIQAEIKGQYFMQGRLVLIGKTINTNSEILKSDMHIVLNNDTIIHMLQEDSFEVTLDRDDCYEVYFSNLGYKSKLLLVDTRNSGENEDGYEMPLEITLEKGNNGKKKITPVGLVFYDSETDLYKTSSYYPPLTVRSLKC